MLKIILVMRDDVEQYWVLKRVLTCLDQALIMMHRRGVAEQTSLDNDNYRSLQWTDSLVEVAKQRSWVCGVHRVEELYPWVAFWILELGLHGVV